MLVFAVLLTVAGGLYFWKQRASAKAAAAPPMSEPPTAVQLVEARAHRWQPTADLVGTVLALQSITVSNEVAGVVKRVGFESGQVVEVGQVLLELDDATERADLASAEASVRVAEAEVRSGDVRVKLAETNLNRLVRALESRAVSSADVDNARAELDRARADADRARSQVDQARAHVEQVRVMLSKKTIKSPFKGRAGLKSVYAGQYLAEGASIVGLQEVSDKVYLDFAIPQEQVWQASPGMKVMATSAMFADQTLVIEVVALDATVNPATRNVRVRGIIDNTGEKLRPGMSVDVRVPVGGMSEHIVVPSSAVRRAAFGDHVFLVAPAKDGVMRASQRFVKTGAMIGADIIIQSGLNAGEKLAAGGAFKLREGAMVIEGMGEAGGHSAAKDGGK